VKVLDFGIAKISDPPRSHRTDANISLGTPAFMAPEQARGRWHEVDEQSDLWALGATLFSVITGRLVHEAETANELLLCAMTASAPRVADVAPNISPGVARVLNRALSFDKRDRFASALEMQEAVRNVLMDRRTRETTTPQVQRVSADFSSHSCTTMRAVVEGESHIVTRASQRDTPGFDGSGSGEGLDESTSQSSVMVSAAI
jgi:serine/threonine protein kinase